MIDVQRSDSEERDDSSRPPSEERPRNDGADEPLLPHPCPAPRGFMFWALAPFLVVFLVLMPMLVPNRNPGAIIILCGVEAAALALLLGLWNSQRFWWAWRGLGAIVFVVYLAYAVAMFVEGRFFGNGRRAETNFVNAILGMIAFGLPGLCYAIFGRLTWRRESHDDVMFDDDDFDDEDDEDDNRIS